MRIFFFFLIALVSLELRGQKISPLGNEAIQLIDARSSEFIAISDSIWGYAEPSYYETRSSAIIRKTLSNEGFRVTGDLLNISSVFIAEYGTEKPVIGLFGEYDADRGAADRMVHSGEEWVLAAYGHGGHHNLLGAGSMAAAVAIKKLIEEGKLKCTIRYYGSTDEGRAGVRRFLSAEGYFNDLDFSLYWHPSPVTWASTAKWDAMTELSVSFSSNDKTRQQYAYELLQNDLNPLKEKSNTEYRLTYTLTDTTLNTRIQCVTQGLCDALYSRIETFAMAISKQTDATNRVFATKNIHQFVPNVTAMRVVHKNINLLSPIVYTEEEQMYTRDKQMTFNAKPEGISYKVRDFTDLSKDRKMYGYSSDIGEVSWIAPEVYFVCKTLPFVAMHTSQGTSFSSHSIGHKGMIQASKILALTIIDYVTDKKLQKAIRADFEEKKKFYRAN